jgi:hypothetical protein
MPKWAKWTLAAFGLLAVWSITSRVRSENAQAIAATAIDQGPRRRLDGEALFRAAEQDVDRQG